MTSISHLKAQAKRLRTHFSTGSRPITHAQALEAVAALHGYADWNTASAAIQAPNKERKRVRAHIAKDLPALQIHGVIEAVMRMAPDSVIIDIHHDATQDQMDEALKCIHHLQDTGHDARVIRYSDADALESGVSVMQN